MRSLRDSVTRKEIRDTTFCMTGNEKESWIFSCFRFKKRHFSEEEKWKPR